MQRFLLFTSLTIIYFFSIFQNANADTDEDVPTVYVSATRSAQSAVSTPALITIITRDDIDASGADHLSDVLESQAGIQLQDLYGDGSRTKISMRGFGADNSAANVLVMVDGRRLNHTDLSAPDLNSVSLKDVEQIEIIQGSAGTLFGDQAVAGVINIITKQQTKLTANTEVGLGSYNAKTLKTSIGNRLASGINYRLSAELKTIDNYRDSNSQDYKNIAMVIRSPIKNGSVGIEYQFIDEYLQLPGALSAAQVATNRRQAASTTDYNDGATNIVRTTYRQSLSKNWNLETELTNRKAEIAGALYGAGFDQQRDHWGLTPRVVGTIPGSRGDTLVTFGIDMDKTDYAFTVPSWFIDTTSAQSMNAIYVQSIAPIRDTLSLTLGARHAHSTDTITDATAFPSGIQLDKSATVTEIGLAKKIDKNWRLFVRRDENLRFAKIDEHTFTDPAVTGLEAQTGVSYELGAQWKKGKNNFNAMLYQLDLDNEIDFDSTADGPWGPGAGANVNLDPTRRLGLNLDGRLQLSSNSALNLQYAYIDAVFRGGSFDGNAIPFVAKHNFTVNVDWRPTPSWRLFAESRTMSDRYQGSDYDNIYTKLPAMTLINLGASYARGPWVVDLRINNVGDIEHSGYANYDYYYPAPKRNFTISAQYNLH